MKTVDAYVSVTRACRGSSANAWTTHVNVGINLVNVRRRSCSCWFRHAMVYQTLIGKLLQERSLLVVRVLNSLHDHLRAERAPQVAVALRTPSQTPAIFPRGAAKVMFRRRRLRRRRRRGACRESSKQDAARVPEPASPPGRLPRILQHFLASQVTSCP